MLAHSDPIHIHHPAVEAPLSKMPGTTSENPELILEKFFFISLGCSSRCRCKTWVDTSTAALQLGFRLSLINRTYEKDERE